MKLHEIEAVSVNHNTWEPTKRWNEAKAKRRDELLSQYRRENASWTVSSKPHLAFDSAQGFLRDRAHF